MKKDIEKIKAYCEKKYKEYCNDERMFEVGMTIAYSNVLFFIENHIEREK